MYQFTGSLLSILCLVSFTALAKEQKPPSDYWRETGLGFAHLEKQGLLTNDNCYTHKTTFQACYAALNALAQSAEPARSLYPKSLKNTFEKGTVTEAELDGGLVLAKVRPGTAGVESKKSLVQLRKETIEKRNQLNAAVDALFAQRKINIQDLYTRVLSVSRVPAKESEQVAATFNSYLNIAVDPHTYITPYNMIKDSQQSTGSEVFYGVGAELGVLGGNVVINRPFEGSPSEKAGVRANDIILSVNGVTIKDMPLGDAVKLIRGPAGTPVRLKIMRNQQILEINIVRGPIETKNVSSKMLENGPKKIGYVKLGSFMIENGCTEVKKEIMQLQQRGVAALIFDLRGNGGGLITQAACIGGLFLGRQLIVTSRYIDSKKGVETYLGDDNAITQLPLVTLIDAGSASASEIVAGALQDYKYGWILGERSFGKGSVQQGGPSELLSGSQAPVAIFKTIARFHQPSGRTNQIIGIIPNFDVPKKPNATEEEQFRMREEDLYTNALPPISKPWEETRPQEAARLRECMSAQGTADQRYGRAQSTGAYADYQLMKAEDLLGCFK